MWSHRVALVIPIFDLFLLYLPRDFWGIFLEWDSSKNRQILLRGLCVIWIRLNIFSLRHTAVYEICQYLWTVMSNMKIINLVSSYLSIYQCNLYFEWGVEWNVGAAQILNIPIWLYWCRIKDLVSRLLVIIPPHFFKAWGVALHLRAAQIETYRIVILSIFKFKSC